MVQTSLGIVVTLLPYPIYEQLFKSLDTHHSEKDDLLYGVLYKVADSDIESVRAHLGIFARSCFTFKLTFHHYKDHREKNGYTTHITTTFHPSTHNPISTQTLIYVATHENEAFLGPSLDHPLTISKSIGPSGLNRDYLFALEKSLKVIMPKGKRDVHVENLCDEVRRLLVGADDEERKGKIKDEDLDELKKLLLLS